MNIHADINPTKTYGIDHYVLCIYVDKVLVVEASAMSQAGCVVRYREFLMRKKVGAV